MPELPEVETVRRHLEPAMAGKKFVRVILNRPDLRTPFPPRFAARLTGKTALAVERRAKYLVVPLSSGETLVMHLGMSGWFEVDVTREDPEDARHDHVVFRMSSRRVVTFNDPRRFGFMDLVERGAAHPVLGTLGPEPLSPEFDAAALATAVKGRKAPLKAVLLDQHVVAGLGNIYVVEALHVAKLSPERQASTIATRAGAPRTRHGVSPAHQAGADRGDRPAVARDVPAAAVPRLRSRSQAVPSIGMPRDDRAPHAGGTVVVLLPGLPAVNVRQTSASGIRHSPGLLPRPGRRKRQHRALVRLAHL